MLSSLIANDRLYLPGKRLPTEAEFEKACQGGKEGSLYPWGDGELVGGVHQANIWQVCHFVHFVLRFFRTVTL